MSKSLEHELDALLKESQSESWTRPTPEKLSYLISAFLPTQPADLRSKAYLVLSSVCQHARKTSSQSKTGEGDPATESLVKLFAPPVASRFQELGETESLVALSFLTALFQVDWRSAASIFSQDNIFDSLIDIIDLSPSADVSYEVARLLAQASAHKACRESISSSKCHGWLEQSSHQDKNAVLRSSAAIALIKLSRGHADDSRDIPRGADGPSSISTNNDRELVALMIDLVVHDGDSSSITDAIEGLAYLSIESQIKENLSKDSAFLTRLFGHVPHLKRSQISLQPSLPNASQMYGIAVIICNICAYPARLSPEQAQIAKLRNITQAPPGSGGKLEETKDPLEEDECVRERCRRMLNAGVVDILSLLIRATDSREVLVLVGKALLSLAEDKENRGRILQSGGSRTLITIIQASLQHTSPSTPHVDEFLLEPIQALSKLAITSSPVHVFGPDEGSSLDAIRPLSLMLIHPSSTLLQQFESMMALTNLSSSSPRVASHVAKAQGLMNKVEMLLLEDHKLVRRAATELICNLIAGSDDVFDKYGGQTETTSSKSKLQVLVALSDVEDEATRLAASGALATVTTSPNACRSLLDLQMDRHRVLPILAQLVDPTSYTDESMVASDKTVNAGLVHRGIICVRNLIGLLDDSSLRSLIHDAQSSGLVRGLIGVVKANVDTKNLAILQPAAEALKRLIDAGALTPEQSVELRNSAVPRT
jgi:Myosin-binding striated muscle assembly central